MPFIRFRLAAIVAAGLGLLALPAAAQTQPKAPAAAPAKPAATEQPVTPEKLALARAIIDFTGAAKSFDPVLPQILVQARTTVLTTNPKLEKDVDEVLGQLETEFSPRRDELRNDIAKIYAENFSEDDLRQLAQFYQSPVGKKMVSVMPNVLRASYGAVQAWAQKLSFDVMGRLREEMKKRGHDL
ncbi:MAG TPA: DUF2059 domain-containing protein [Hyphomicrobiales bacterium]|nr:DUF2059 domain-containing protein [Hyphomicrobiales bacterium]